jgi:hypothetical protein
MSKAATLYRALPAFLTGVLLIAAGLALAPGAARAEASQHLHFGLSPEHSNVLVMIWRGEIKRHMSEDISAAFEQYKDTTTAVEFKIDSGGGSVSEGERVIKVLQEIKKTHKLYTAVGAGKKCGSMCVFIYVQGEKRLAAPASLWLFHEVSQVDKETHQITRLDRASWERLVDQYWVPAGVNPDWIKDVKTHTVGTDYWESGESLLRDGSNIVTKALSDEHRRVVKASNDAE